MKMKYYLSSFVLLTMICSCSNISKDGEGIEAAYFPIKEFTEVTAENLEGKSLIKEVNINGEKQKVNTTPNSEEWLKELDFFVKADINNPSLAQSYHTERSEMALIHNLKDGEKGKVKRIVVKYLEGNVKEVSFRSKTENPFYSSETRGVMIFHSESGKLDQYSIENLQEVVFSKPNKMIISASIVD
jgi:hypothetical protein